ncbi:MAG: hypothetical protein QM784_17805 [Polyangiaceae bacterium]
MYVKKRLSDEELSFFKTHGFVKLNVGLEDSAKDSIKFSDLNYRLSATSYFADASKRWRPLSAPIVYGAMYSACKGPTDDGADPCCNDASCRSSINEVPPVLVRLGSAKVPIGFENCGELPVWELSNIPLDFTLAGGTKQEVRACMKNVQTSPIGEVLSPVDANQLNNPAELMKPVRNDLCANAPANLNLAAGKLWGAPLFGDWSLGYNTSTAMLVRRHQADELDGKCDSTVPGKSCDGLSDIGIDPDWAKEIATYTGLELTIIVGAEPLPARETLKYQQTTYRSSAWRDVEPSWADYEEANQEPGQ